MTETPATVFQRIRSAGDTLSPKRRQLAEYVLNHYKKVAFMTSTELGNAAGVSEASVFRLAVALGYSGFPAFQAALQEVITEEITTVERFSVSPGPDDDTLLAKVFAAEAKNMNRVLGLLSPADFNKGVELLFTSRRVLVVGHQVSAALASHAGYTMSKVRSGVHTIREWNENVFAYVQDMGPEDLAWVHAFPRYPTSTVQMVEVLRARGVPILLVTNSYLSQLAPFATVLLPVPIRYDAFVDSLAPAICLVNSLVLGTALKDPEMTKQHLERFEAFITATKVFCPGQARPEA